MKKDKINILYLIDKLDTGGTQLHLLEVIKHLDRQQFHPVVCCLTAKDWVAKEIEKLDVQVHCLGMKRIYQWRCWEKVRYLQKLMHKEQIDIAHSYLISSDIVATIATDFSPRPIALITTRRDMGINRSWRLNLIEKFFVNPQVSRVLTVSQRLRKMTTAEPGLAPHKVIAVRNGIDISRFSPVSSGEEITKLKTQLGIKPTEKVVGIVANLTPIKGHDLFFNTASLLLREYPRLKFLVVGDGPLRQQYEQLVNELNIKDKVIFTGSRTDTANLLSLMDVFVLTSFSEGISNALLEAMAMARPVVVTNVGGNPEVVEHGKTGFLISQRDPFQMANVIATLLHDDLLAKRMGQAGRARIERLFTARQMVQQMETIYQTVVRKFYRRLDAPPASSNQLKGYNGNGREK